jgi:hypothetical protein
MLTLILVMSGGLVLVIAAALVLTAHMILHPPRMTDGKAMYVLQRLSPGDLGMHFEAIRFTIHDHRTHRAIDLASWWIPHPAGGTKTVVLIHGYADAKVGAIAWAPTWRELGYHVLAIDLRAHGESDGQYTTAGVFERHDLDQLLNQLRAAKPQQTAQILLFGASLGAVVALATTELRDDIAAVVLECPLVSFRRGVEVQARLAGLPLSAMLPLTMKIANWMCGADLDEIQPLSLIAQVKCPVMVIQSADDPFAPPADVLAIEEAIAKRSDKSVFWLVPDAPHLLALAGDPVEYQRRIVNFLSVLPM